MSLRHRASALLVAAVALMIASLAVYKHVPIAGVALGVGSGVVAAAVLVHLGVLAALLAPFALFRQFRRRKN